MYPLGCGSLGHRVGLSVSSGETRARFAPRIRQGDPARPRMFFTGELLACSRADDGLRHSKSPGAADDNRVVLTAAPKFALWRFWRSSSVERSFKSSAALRSTSADLRKSAAKSPASRSASVQLAHEEKSL